MAFLGRPGLRSGAVSDGRHLLAETLSRFRSQSLRPLDQRVPGTLADVQRRSRVLPGSPIGASAVAVFARPGTVAIESVSTRRSGPLRRLFSVGRYVFDCRERANCELADPVLH